MIIDHVGQFFFPQSVFLRAIGRLSFPLFAWLIANGAYYTKNINKYLVRIGVLAVISQVPYFFANRLLDPDFSKLNVLFTLFLGALAIKLLKNKRLFVRFFALIIVFVALKWKMSFGLQGIVSIIAFYFFFNKPAVMMVAQIVIYSSKYLFYTLLLGPFSLLAVALQHNFFEPLALFSLPIITLYNGKKGGGYKYFFYLFYPLQYVFYYLVKLLIS